MNGGAVVVIELRNCPACMSKREPHPVTGALVCPLRRCHLFGMPVKEASR